MPRQIHITVTKDQQERCWQYARTQNEAITWQEIARRCLDIGLDELPPKAATKPKRPA